MENSSAGRQKLAEQVEVLQAVTRILAGVALRSMEVLHGAATLPQFRLLAVLAEGTASRSSEVAGALGMDASSVTRLADRLVARGYVARSSDPRHRSVVNLTLTPVGRNLVSQVEHWRQAELARIIGRLAPGDRTVITTTLRQLMDAAGEGYGVALDPSVPM